MKRTLLLAVVVVVTTTACNGGPGSAEPTSTAGAATTSGHAAGSAARPPFRRSVVVSCLRRRGAVVGPVQPSNTRLRALRDLAQKTSVQARVGRDVVGLAFTRTGSEAQFLVELLEVPKDPYRLSRRRNVVLLYRPAPGGARTAVGACLR